MVPLVSFQPRETSSSILRDISTQTVFLELEGKTINFWVLNKEHEVNFRQKEVEARCAMNDTATYVQHLKNAFQAENEIGRDAAKCEDRSLDGLRGDDHQHLKSRHQIHHIVTAIRCVSYMILLSVPLKTYFKVKKSLLFRITKQGKPILAQLPVRQK